MCDTVQVFWCRQGRVASSLVSDDARYGRTRLGERAIPPVTRQFSKKRPSLAYARQPASEHLNAPRRASHPARQSRANSGRNGLPRPRPSTSIGAFERAAADAPRRATHPTSPAPILEETASLAHAHQPASEYSGAKNIPGGGTFSQPTSCRWPTAVATAAGAA